VVAAGWERYGDGPAGLREGRKSGRMQVFTIGWLTGYQCEGFASRHPPHVYTIASYASLCAGFCTILILVWTLIDRLEFFFAMTRGFSCFGGAAAAACRWAQPRVMHRQLAREA